MEKEHSILSVDLGENKASHHGHLQAVPRQQRWCMPTKRTKLVYIHMIEAIQCTSRIVFLISIGIWFGCVRKIRLKNHRQTREIYENFCYCLLVIN